MICEAVTTALMVIKTTNKMRKLKKRRKETQSIDNIALRMNDERLDHSGTSNQHQFDFIFHVQYLKLNFYSKSGLFSPGHRVLTTFFFPFICLPAQLNQCNAFRKNASMAIK